MHSYNYNIIFSDPPYTTAYNVTISSSLTPADLTGFDIIISWTVCNSAFSQLLHKYSHCLVFVIILYLVGS